MKSFNFLKKGSKLYSIFKTKCPRCHEANFFEHAISYHPKKVIKQKSTCTNCNLKYMIEPSFFFGAMYVSYAINVALIVLFFTISKVFLNMKLIHSFIATLLVVVSLTPVILRLSRIVWINIFVHYDVKFKAKI